MTLLGAPEWRRRMAAVLAAPKGIEREWARATVPVMRGYVRSRTGKTRGSLRSRDNAVIGSPVVNFLSSGTKAHDIEAKQGTLKFESAGRTYFRKRVHKPQQRGQHFKRKAAEQGLASVRVEQRIVKAWDGAA